MLRGPAKVKRGAVRAGCGSNAPPLASANRGETVRDDGLVLARGSSAQPVHLGGDPGRRVQHPGQFRRAGHRNRLVWTIGDFLYRITEPALRPIRNLLPNLGGIDISPIILILLLQAARMLLGEIEFSLVRSIF